MRTLPVKPNKLIRFEQRIFIYKYKQRRVFTNREESLQTEKSLYKQRRVFTNREESLQTKKSLYTQRRVFTNRIVFTNREESLQTKKSFYKQNSLYKQRRVFTNREESLQTKKTTSMTLEFLSDFFHKLCARLIATKLPCLIIYITVD